MSKLNLDLSNVLIGQMNSFSTLPSRRVLLLPERVVRMDQNITMQGGKIYHGVVVQSNVAPGESIEERIRQIVREEIAAHEERRHQEVIFFSRCDCRTCS